MNNTNDLKKLCEQYGIETSTSTNVEEFIEKYKIEQKNFHYECIRPISNIKLKPISQINFK